MMKYIFIILIFITFSANAQDYAFPTSNASWHNTNITYYDNGSGKIMWQTTNHVYIKGDSMINDKKYHILEGFNRDINRKSISALYRVEGEKVFRLKHDSTEFLEYDFGLELGDTFNASNGGTFIVQKIDSIELNDGFHKVIDFGWAKFIRGIGSPQGLFAFLGGNVSNFSTELVCFSHIDTTLYPLYLKESCYDLTKHLKAKGYILNTLKIFPNPASDYVIIDDFKNTDVLKLFNILGEEQKVDRTFNSLDIRWLPVGLYFINLRRGGITYRSKILKN